ncbi:unnamed protein product [Cyprideis torosa]|uniref:Uncharacterized protein n=1 Tax=Cyprideis torosa TaxID=163714 RepID=A0A7R8WA85_9CRUS|nr:unnamed protein product [Cyprideis torosa]CAG0889379.1 unnamed protein product [Cyprideis torosa]
MIAHWSALCSVDLKRYCTGEDGRVWLILSTVTVVFWILNFIAWILVLIGIFRDSRYQFLKLRQEENERFDTYVTRLWKNATTFYFDDIDNRILNQVIVNCRQDSMRRKLQMIGEELTLKKALKIARALEATDAQLSVMGTDTPEAVVRNLVDSVSVPGDLRNTFINLVIRGLGRGRIYIFIIMAILIRGLDHSGLGFSDHQHSIVLLHHPGLASGTCSQGLDATGLVVFSKPAITTKVKFPLPSFPRILTPVSRDTNKWRMNRVIA